MGLKSNSPVILKVVMQMSNLIFYALSSNEVAEKAKEYLGKGLPGKPDDIKLFFEDKGNWPKIHKDIQKMQINWLLIDQTVLYSKNYFDYRRLKKHLEKLIYNFAGGPRDGILILDPTMTNKEFINAICHRFYIYPKYIESLEEIQIVVDPLHHLTFWIEDDHLHVHTRKYPSATGVGAKKHSNDDNDQLFEFVQNIKTKPAGICYKKFAHQSGTEFKKYLKSQPNKIKNSGDLLKDILSPQVRLKERSSISIICEKENHFPLPFEFISPNGNLFDMWTFQHSVIHQIPTCSPPNLEIPGGPTRFLLIDASTDIDVKGFTLPNGTPNDGILEGLPEVSTEIKKIERALKNYKEKVPHPISIKTREFNDVNEVKMHIFDEDIHIIHFAGHSGIENDAVYFHWPLKNNEKNTISITKFLEILSLNRPYLLYLSSCEVGQDRALLKMAEYIPFIIAHRWPVEDEEAPKFAEDFYRNLLERVPNPARALHFAKFRNQDMRASLSSIFICGRQNQLL